MADRSNPYFQSNYFGAPEQALTDSLTVESIQIHGIGVKYIPREEVAMDDLFGEDKLSKFRVVYDIEMYIKSFEQFGGDGDFLSKFGLEIRDELILQVSKTRWTEEVQIAASSSPTPPYLLPARPREGDLIFFPFSNRLFEISFVEHEEVFYQVGKLFTYELRCKLFEYSSQQFDTGVESIDAIEDFAQQIELNLASGTGNFQVGELAYQGPQMEPTASGTVVSWEAPKLIVKLTKGEFGYGTPITGETSNAIWSYIDEPVGEVKFQNRNVADTPTNNKTVASEYDGFDIDSEINELSRLR